MNINILELYKVILGDLDIYFVISFYFYVVFGLILSTLIHYKRKQVKDIKNDKVSAKFSAKFWIKDNVVRVLTVLMCVFIVLVFKNNIPFLKDYELNNWLGLLIGLFFDSIIILIRKKTKTSIFRSRQN